MTRQQAYQRRHRESGLCIICPKERDPNSADFCRGHAIKHRKRARKAAGCKPKYAGGPGRPISVK